MDSLPELYIPKNSQEGEADKGKVRVIVTVIGRASPVDVDYWQVDKM